MGIIIAVPLANQLQVVFIKTRTIYEIRERPSRMYSWSALVASQVLVEVPWNMLGSTVYFFCWFWPIGFPADRAGYTFLVLAVLFPLHITTFAQALAAMAPNTTIASLTFSLLFSLTFTL